MKMIPLTQGKEAIVDDEDYDYLIQRRWYAVKARYNRASGWYAVTGGGKSKLVYMHRVVANASHGEITDHVNGNGLDNRRLNIRICTKTENNRNRGKSQTNTTGYKGVCPSGRLKNKYKARISVNNRDINLGAFDNPIDAAKAYDAAARKYHGKYAVLNFPD